MMIEDSTARLTDSRQTFAARAGLRSAAVLVKPTGRILLRRYPVPMISVVDLRRRELKSGPAFGERIYKCPRPY